MEYAIRRAFDAGFGDVDAAVRAALADAGFGILTEIDVQAKMKEKLDKDMPRYTILGACAPPMAWKGLQAQPDLGVFLPCNVVVYEHDGKTVVSAMEPRAALPIIGDPAVTAVGEEVSDRLRAVLDGLEVPA